MRLLFFHCVTISPINFLDLSCLSKILELENTVMYIILSTFLINLLEHLSSTTILIYLTGSMKSTGKDSMEVDVDQPGDRVAEDDDNAQTKFARWRDLFNFTSKAHTLVLILALILSIASGIVIPALAVFIGKIFDYFTDFGGEEISGPDLKKKVSTYARALLALGCASGLLNAFYFSFWMLFGELQAKSARERLFEGMLDKDMEWYDKGIAGIDTRLQA